MQSPRNAQGEHCYHTTIILNYNNNIILKYKKLGQVVEQSELSYDAVRHPAHCTQFANPQPFSTQGCLGISTHGLTSASSAIEQPKAISGIETRIITLPISRMFGILRPSQVGKVLRTPTTFKQALQLSWVSMQLLLVILGQFLFIAFRCGKYIYVSIGSARCSVSLNPLLLTS